MTKTFKIKIETKLTSDVIHTKNQKTHRKTKKKPVFFLNKFASDRNGYVFIE